MTTRIPVSAIQNKWSDAQKVDKSDMDTEQSFNNKSNHSIVQNFFGSGILLENPEPKIIFSTDNLDAIQAALLSAGNFDGTGLNPHLQPSDINLGNQLSITLSESEVFGRFSVKVLIIGLSFDGQLQMERMNFHKNETQTTYRHYARILTIMFNDFLGNNNCSRTFGGKIVIKEALPYELNRDTIISSQDVEPDIFFRDFKVADSNKDLFVTIQEAIGPEFDADNLHINITGRQPARSIGANDTVTRIGQKFLATSDNIQKVTLLLGAVRNPNAAVEDWFNWTGDLVVSIYPLQRTVSCPTDIVPELAIEFDPSQNPISEQSFSQLELRSLGIVLTDVAQPVDFVFTNTSISVPGGINKGTYYAIVLRRSGASDVGTIFAEVGNDRTTNSRLAMFNGSWVDVVEEDLWYQVYAASAKHASGQAYDMGVGISFPKTTVDAKSGATVDNYSRNLPFVSTGQNINNVALLQHAYKNSITVQDERTGNNVFSRQQSYPEFSFVTNQTLSLLKETSEPLILGCMTDNNPKINVNLNKLQSYPGLVKGNKFSIINPDADLLSLNLIGRKLLPDDSCGNFEYRIFKSTLCVDGYGDTNGDGYISQEDVDRASVLIGESLLLESTQTKIVNGEINVLELLRADVDGDGYISAVDIDLIQSFVNRSINSFPVGTSFRHLELEVQNSIGRWDGYYDCDGEIRSRHDGYQNTIDPITLSTAEQIYYGNPIPPSIDGDNPLIWNAVPFVDVSFCIEFQPFWQPWLLGLASGARELPSTFTFDGQIDQPSCLDSLAFNCEERSNVKPACDPGRNDFYVPGNLILGKGDILRPNGDPLRSDIEVAIINLELPAEPFVETSFDVFRDFVSDRGDGFTNASYNALRYYDCSTVQPEDLALNKVRFGVSIQSFVPNLDGYSLEDGYGIIVDPVIGVYMDHVNGILRLSIRDLDVNSLYQTMVTKIQISVYLKKAGWNNQVLTITPDEISNLGLTV